MSPSSSNFMYNDELAIDQFIRKLHRGNGRFEADTRNKTAFEIKRLNNFIH